MSSDDNRVTYRFETDEETINQINSIEAKLGMTHEEFVLSAAEFIEDNEGAFKRHSRGESRR